LKVNDSFEFELSLNTIWWAICEEVRTYLIYI